MARDPSVPEPRTLAPGGKLPGQKCSARTTSGRPCSRWAIVGGTVCTSHGGAAPQVREAARKRILAFAPVALQVLQDIATDPDAAEASRVRAAIDLLDRAGLKVAEEHVLIPAEQANADLDAAIAQALAARQARDGGGDQALDVDLVED